MAEKSIVKGAAKFGVKAIPVVGTFVGAYFVEEDLKEKNYTRAAVDFAEAIPVVGDYVLGADITVQLSVWGINKWSGLVGEISVSINQQVRNAGR